ncbi:hypothetical protein M3182_21890 [Mesobacillus maritimus]|uniref:hypothetical protein n=1 Tax=Mesobacillus maritimus TaxID=1643336 RepID=UPI00203F3B57|nr:hypothetical protein [Mesobacillus maritimus]MCM3588334.1 hypothetical protein [Mesobacillus maritimus]MCM3671527.1 hypothetical protein [Mesobacillus maritimus]
MYHYRSANHVNDQRFIGLFGWPLAGAFLGGLIGGGIGGALGSRPWGYPYPYPAYPGYGYPGFYGYPGYGFPGPRPF